MRRVGESLHAFGLVASNIAQKASWNPVGVEPIHWKPAHINSGSPVSGTNQKRTLVRSKWYDSNKKGGTRAGTPHPRSFLGGVYELHVAAGDVVTVCMK